jgi:hypothetical protein
VSALSFPEFCRERLSLRKRLDRPSVLPRHRAFSSTARNADEDAVGDTAASYELCPHAELFHAFSQQCSLVIKAGRVQEVGIRRLDIRELRVELHGLVVRVFRRDNVSTGRDDGLLEFVYSTLAKCRAVIHHGNALCLGDRYRILSCIPGVLGVGGDDPKHVLQALPVIAGFVAAGPINGMPAFANIGDAGNATPEL